MEMTEKEKFKRAAAEFCGLLQVCLDRLDTMEQSGEFQAVFVRKLKMCHNNYKKELEKVISVLYKDSDVELDKQLVEMYRAIDLLLKNGLIWEESKQ